MELITNKKLDKKIILIKYSLKPRKKILREKPQKIKCFIYVILLLPRKLIIALNEVM